MYLHIYTYINAYTYTCTYIYTHTHTHTINTHPLYPCAQRYTGVKVKFKPSTTTESTQVNASSASPLGTTSKEGEEGGATASASTQQQPKQKQSTQQGTASDTREIFIGMFPSGKAVITGAVRWEEVRQSYEFARAVLCDHFDYLKVPVATGGSAGRKKAKRAANQGFAPSATSNDS